MELLSSLFSPDDFSLVTLILGLPLLGAFVNGVFGRRLGREGVRLMTLVASGGAFAAALVAFAILAHGGEQHPALTFTAWHWLDLSLANGHGSTPVDVAFLIDRLSSVMMLVITGVGFLIHIYATEYMWDDPRASSDGGFHRFFAYLNLFLFAMLVLVLGKSLPVLFVGWEGVGLCSYLLIGFWYSDEQNASAGKKAFITNRIGDFGLLVAMALLLKYTGSLDWDGIGQGWEGLFQPLQVWPLGNGFTGPFAILNRWTLTPNVATVVALMLFLGCAGKSAQIPLYVWLPDAMAGPTPVSALIHAATMVTAGVYLVCRLAGVFLLAPAAMAVVAFVGALTALFAATIGLAQTDIKKVLAYSTVSQLGYMFLGVGVGAFSSGLFHVVTHAFFKACLFLGAGSVIHAMHARIHDTNASQDLRNMGGLRKWMPLTYASFLASCIAIAGIFPFSGFFSKDEILYRAVVNRIDASHIAPPGVSVFVAPIWFGWLLFAMGLAAAVLTAFYMFRALFLAFHGTFRGWVVDETAPAHPQGAHGSELAHSAPAAELAHAAYDLTQGDPGHGDHAHGAQGPGPAPTETPPAMSWVLVALGVLATFGGFLNAGLLSHRLALLDHWLEPVFSGVESIVHVREHAASEVGLALLGLLAGALGIGGAYWVYLLQAGKPAADLAERAPSLYRLVLDKWRIDELYDRTVLAAVDSLAETATVFDSWIDGLLARLTALVVSAAGTLLRALQTGVVHAYAAVFSIGVLAFGWFFVVAPHPQATVVESAPGRYTLEAAPGLGYQYRWRAIEVGAPDRASWDGRRSFDVDVSPGEKRRIVLEVKNAFNRTATRQFLLDGRGPSAQVGLAPSGTEVAR